MTATQAGRSVIPQRDLRNRSGEILRRAQAGESFAITTNGQVTALLSSPESALAANERQPIRSAVPDLDWDAIPLTEAQESVQAMLDDLRGDW
ncbi:MAG: type II toxin-antitoxin system prevent-host-death family antitoxin [Micrococcales bacterium]|nr:type II toxin-antitoxin system prevent-host-death family antitoxin [Micrococcales bacterium]